MTDIYWLKSKETGEFRGCGFITMSSVEEAQKVLDLPDKFLEGKALKISFSTPRNK